MSRMIKFAQPGGPEVLEFIEVGAPEPGPHEVRIKVKAIGINRADSMWRNDKYVESPIFPAGLGLKLTRFSGAPHTFAGGFPHGQNPPALLA
jgi:NADPH:quinone reductase-like Zn-dependent oxidoreductase